MAQAYTAPIWTDGSGEGISASNLQAISNALQGIIQGSDKAIHDIAINGSTITFTYVDGTIETAQAANLKGISSIAKTGTSGNVDTYTITYTDGSTSTFTVTNGAEGSFYIVTAGIKSTDDPYGNIEYYIGGDFYKNGVLYNQSAFYKVTLVDETEYPPSPYLIDGSSGTFTNGHYSTGSIGGIPSGATITTQIFTDSTMTTLLGMVKVIIGLQGSEGEQGPAGDDGVSPEVTITTITGGHRVNITDAEHPSGQNFDVLDGQDGASDWSEITNKPNFATVATSGSYNDLSNKPTIPDEVTANPQGTATGTLTKLGIGSDIYDIQGGGGGIDGSTVTPINDISIWLECAGLHQSYTTLNEVLADSGVLYALINSTNAVDYMVRSTTWASSVCANQTAMNYIGNNNYCADVLLADSTWNTAICNSAYFDEWLNSLVPVMTSNTTPEGVASCSSYYQNNDSYNAWRAFDDGYSTGWLPANSDSFGSAYCQYEFVNPVRVNKLGLRMCDNTATYTYKLQGSNDGSTFTDLLTNIQVHGTSFDYSIVSNTTKYKYYRLVYMAGTHGINAGSGVNIEMWGRSDLPPVDDRINAKADKTDIAPVENGSTASKAYSANNFFIRPNGLYIATTSIAQGAQFTVGTNCVKKTIGEVLTTLLNA